MRKLTLLFAVLFSLQLFAEPQNGVVYVKSGGTGEGTSWSDAMGDIQQAIAKARDDDRDARKDVWVAGGTFVISTALNVIDSVNVYGSFSGTESDLADRPQPDGAKPWEFSSPTILKGDGARLFQAGGPMDIETVVDGFTMEDGNGVGSALSGSGGAVVVRHNVAYQNCIMRNNSVAGGGGAAIMTGGIIRNSLLENNTQDTGANGGGAIFSNPPAGYPSYIEGNEIRYNSTTIRGAGIGVQGAEMSYVSNNKIYGNIAADGTTLKPGAGVYSNSANNRLMNNMIYNNTGVTAVYYNGGNLFNNTITKNIGGVYLAGNVIKVINNVVWGCVTEASGATATSISGNANSSWVVHNNGTYNPIPTDKGWDIDGNFQFASNMSNGDVEDPKPETVGSGPRFESYSEFIGAPETEEEKAELEAATWELMGNSPCVDAGETLEDVVEDFYGIARPQGFPVETAMHDVGAYELPYFTVVVGEAADANGSIYSSMGELIPENDQQGYAKSSMMELFFDPNPDYELGRAYYIVSTDGGFTFTGEEVDFTDEIDQDGFWTTFIHNSFKVFVEWNSLTSVKKLQDTHIHCFVTSQGVRIQGVESGDAVRIYNASGMLVHHSRALSSEIDVPLSSGFYLVHLNEGVQKILVK